ncbi:minor capsid protein [Sutcliffiella halmapala]
MSKLNEDLLKLLENLFEQSDQSFEDVLSEYRKSNGKLKQLVANLYMEYSIDGEISLTQTQLQKAIKEIGLQIEKELRKIGTLEIALLTSLLSTVFTQSYYRTTYTLEKNIGIKISFNRLNKSIIDAFLKENWSGKHFSQRIWSNLDQLNISLANNLRKGIQNGYKLDKIAKLFDKEFGSKAYQSQRLVRTETARIIETSRQKVYQDNGVDKVQWLATLDQVTSEGCRELDGKIFSINDSSKPKCPRHPNCRSTYVPYLDFGTNLRKDNETKEYIPYKNYREWEKANKL